MGNSRSKKSGLHYRDAKHTEIGLHIAEVENRDDDWVLEQHVLQALSVYFLEETGECVLHLELGR